MKIKLCLITTGILFSLHAFADGYVPNMTSQDQPWSVTASAGAVRYPHIHSIDNKSPLARLALGNELLLGGDIALGLEFGLQNGNHLRLNLPRETLAVLNWLPVRTNLGPMLDLLITAKSDPIGKSSFFAQLKGGVAYRHWQIENAPINDLSKLAGEVQAGFGYPITALASLNLLYQGVFGSDPSLRVNSISKTGHISNIPSLHAVLFGLSVNL